MPNEDALDINKVIEQSAKRTTLSDLARKGIQRVKVLDERAIHDLIRQAVEKVIASRTNLMADDDRAKVFAESRKELDRLLKEHNESRSRAELLEADKVSLVQQVENLQRQLQLLRKLEEENVRKRAEEQTGTLQARLQEAQERHEAAQRELKTLRGEINRRMTEQAGAQGDLDAAREEAARLREDLAAARAQLQSAGSLDAKLAEMQHSLEAKFQAAQESSLAAKLEALGAKDNEAAAKLERMFARMTDNLGKKIGAIRAAGGAEETEYRPGELALESMFKQELESNLQSLEGVTEQREESGGKMQGALAKLRAMRPGGPPGGAPPEKK